MALSDGEISDGLLLSAVEVGLITPKYNQYPTAQCYASIVRSVVCGVVIAFAFR